MSGQAKSIRHWAVRAAAVAFGGVLALGVGRVVFDDDPTPSASPSRSMSATDADQFLARWERWRRASFVGTEVTTRRRGAEQLSETARVVQRWPDSVVTSGTSVSAHVRGRLVGCAPTAKGVACSDDGAYRPTDQLRTELAGLRAAITGPGASYRLSVPSANCVRLRLVTAEFRPLLGDQVDYCFDPRTAVVVSERQQRSGLEIDVERKTERIRVTDSDLRLPAPVTIG